VRLVWVGGGRLARLLLLHIVKVLLEKYKLITDILQ